MKPLLLLCALLLTTGCVTHERYTFFEPQGLSSSTSDTIPHAVYFLHYGKAILTVDGRTQKIGGTMSLNLSIPQGEHIRFASNAVRLVQGSETWTVTPTWNELRMTNGRWRWAEVNFDTMLEGKSYGGKRPEKRDAEFEGVSRSEFSLPKEMRLSEPFAMVLPAVDNFGPATRIEFVPKAIDHWRMVQLQ